MTQFLPFLEEERNQQFLYGLWQTFPELTLPLQLLAGPCPTVEMGERHLPRLEMFAVKLYGLDEEQAFSVDEARLYLLKHQGKSFDKMPPSSDAYYQHILGLCMQLVIFGAMH